MVKDLLNTPIEWRDDFPASEWPGVHLDPSGEVTAIQWNALELRGPMHWENTTASLIIFECGGHRTQCNYLTGELQLESLPQGLTKLVKLNQYSQIYEFSKFHVPFCLYFKLFST